MHHDYFFASPGLPGLLVFALIIVVPLWRIFGRAGFHPAWSLLVFIPAVGWIVALCWLGFLRWPRGERADA